MKARTRRGRGGEGRRFIPFSFTRLMARIESRRSATSFGGGLESVWEEEEEDGDGDG